MLIEWYGKRTTLSCIPRTAELVKYDLKNNRLISAK